MASFLEFRASVQFFHKDARRSPLFATNAPWLVRNETQQSSLRFSAADTQAAEIQAARRNKRGGERWLVRLAGPPPHLGPAVGASHVALQFSRCVAEVRLKCDNISGGDIDIPYATAPGERLYGFDDDNHGRRNQNDRPPVRRL